MPLEIWVKIQENAEKTLYTFKNLPFTYMVKGNEIFIDRKKKSITRASVEFAYKEVIKLNGIVTGPKQLGVFGASYLYAIFKKIGIIQGDK